MKKRIEMNLDKDQKKFEQLQKAIEDQNNLANDWTSCDSTLKTITQSTLLAEQMEEEGLLLQAETTLNLDENPPALSAPPYSKNLDSQELQSSLETLLFIADKPISLKNLQEYLQDTCTHSQLKEALLCIQTRYQSLHHGIELLEIAGGYQFRTKGIRSHLAKKWVKIQVQRLSSGSMETIAIIAYQQPIMKEEIDRIRGVDSAYFIRGLIDKKLIEISGRSELPGRPILYTTTPHFLEIFGLKDLTALPSLRELEQMIPSSETSNPENETPSIREMRRMVQEMKSDRSSPLHFNPKEDEKILNEIRVRVNAIQTSSPYLDQIKADELQASKMEQIGPETENKPILPSFQS